MASKPYAASGRYIQRMSNHCRGCRYDPGVPFAYYDRLSRRDQAVYRKSDAVAALPLRGARELAPVVEALRAALACDDVRGVAAARTSGGIFGFMR